MLKFKYPEPVNVTSFENRDLADIIKIKWNHEVGPSPMLLVSLKKKKTDIQREDKSGDWRDPSTSQGVPRIASKCQELEEPRKDFTLQIEERAWHCSCLNFRFLTFIPKRIHFCCFKLPSLWHFCFGSPRKWTHKVITLRSSCVWTLGQFSQCGPRKFLHQNHLEDAYYKCRFLDPFLCFPRISGTKTLKSTFVKKKLPT